MEHQKAKVSVIIPCYNVAAYIDRCMKSILNQNYGFENLELIFIDDCSTDDTMVHLERIEQLYSENVLLVKMDENSGPATTRNVGLQYASGEYVVFADGDDLLGPEMISELMRLSVMNDCDVSECAYGVFEEIEQIVFEQKGKDVFIELTNEKARLELLINSRKTAVWGRLYKKDFLVENQLYFPDGSYNLEDVFFSGLATFYINRYCKTDKKLYWYYKNSEGLDHSPYNSARMRNEVQVLDCLLEEIRNRNNVIAENQISSELEYICLLHGMLVPLSKIVYSNPGGDMMMEEALFLARHINRLFPNAYENKFLNQLEDNTSKLAVKVLQYVRKEGGIE